MVKYILVMILMLALTVQSALGACDFSTGIKPLPDGTFSYSKDCHLAVGKMKNDLDAANTQIEDLNKAITFKDLAMVDSNKRVELWQKTTWELQDRMATIESYNTKSNVLYFALGIIVTGAAVYGAGQLVRH